MTDMLEKNLGDREVRIKLRKVIYIFIAVSLLIFVGISEAAEVTFKIGQNQYIKDGQTIQMDAKPFIQNSRTYVPVKYLADALSLKTSWDGDQQEVTLSNEVYSIKMKIGSKELMVNGNSVLMDVAPMIRSNRTYLPARWVAEAVSCEIEAKGGQVVISKGVKEKGFSMSLSDKEIPLIQGTDMIDVRKQLEKVGISNIQFDGKTLTATGKDGAKELRITEGQAGVKVYFGKLEQSFDIPSKPKVINGSLGVSKDCLPTLVMMAMAVNDSNIKNY